MEKAVLALQMLVEGSSIRTTGRTRCEKCKKLMGRLIVNIPVKDVQCDELWGHVGKKEKNKGSEEAHNDSIGGACCFVAIERHTKLILDFALGRRTRATTNALIEGLRHATSSRPFQLTADGFAPSLSAIDATLGDRVDHAMLVKQYAEKPESEKLYSPAERICCRKQSVIGSPDPPMISTGHVERQNLTIRMQMRRLTRSANGFCRKWENLWTAYCLHFAYYNFCRVHKTVRVPAAMESGLTDHIWTIAELLA